VANSLGVAAGLVFSETGAGAVLAVYCAYGAGASFGNMINAIMDTPAGPTGPASALVQVTMISANANSDSCPYRYIDYGAQIVDLTVPLIASGGLDWRLVTSRYGYPGIITLEKCIPDPQTATLSARIAVGADATITAGEKIGDAVNSGKK